MKKSGWCVSAAKLTRTGPASPGARSARRERMPLPRYRRPCSAGWCYYPRRERRFKMRNYRILQVAAAFAALAIIVPLDSKQAKADDNAVAEAWILAWNSLDPNAVVAIFTEDAFYEDIPSGQKYRGRAELHAFAKAVFDSLP